MKSRGTYEFQITCLSPIWGNSSFKPGRLDAGFKVWADKGIKTIADFNSSNQLMSFEEIAHSFDTSLNTNK